MSKNYIIMSDENKDINRSIGSNIIPTDSLEDLLPFEKRHADIQCLKINDTFFVLKEAVNLQKRLSKFEKKVIITEENIANKYPKNILLNAVYIKGMLFCKTDALAGVVKDYCKNNKIKIINVNQGYTKCSTAVFNDYFITADRGIFNKMTENGVEGLLIKSGSIKLPGTDYGFIGGCSYYNNGTLYFTGDIKKHPDSEKIETFIKKRKVNIRILTNEELYDIGGFILL